MTLPLPSPASPPAKVRRIKSVPPPRPDSTTIRGWILRYFYDRNAKASSPGKGKRGAGAGISDVKKDLKNARGLTQPEVVSNLNYLVSQGWVDHVVVPGTFTTKTGFTVGQPKMHYQISAKGVDKIEGEGEFTMKKYEGINITATGQNIISLGDNVQIDARFESVGRELIELSNGIKGSDKVTDTEKLAAFSNIETIQAQLASPEPNKAVVSAVWPTIQRVATTAGLVANVAKIGTMIAGFLA